MKKIRLTGFYYDNSEKKSLNEFPTEISNDLFFAHNHNTVSGQDNEDYSSNSVVLHSYYESNNGEDYKNNFKEIVLELPKDTENISIEGNYFKLYNFNGEFSLVYANTDKRAKREIFKNNMLRGYLSRRISEPQKIYQTPVSRQIKVDW